MRKGREPGNEANTPVIEKKNLLGFTITRVDCILLLYVHVGVYFSSILGETIEVPL